MDATALLGEWAATASILCGERNPLARFGPCDHVFPWASVSKMAIAALVGVDVQRGECDFNEPLGPEGSSLAHLLSHSSGLGPSRDALGARVGSKRIYSNYGFELIVERLGGLSVVVENCRSVLGLNSVVSDGTPAGGLVGTLEDLETLAWLWLGNGSLSDAILREMTSAFLPELGGAVPGFGSWQPCPWGLGPQIKGDNDHWMGSGWPPTTFGHFGQSGSMILIDQSREFAVVALSSRQFGPWAVTTWPGWTSRVYEMTP